MKGIVLCFLATIVIQLATEGEAVCCHGKGPLWKSVCADCSKGTPYCALGKSCNIFGCNCEGGCRMGHCHSPHGHGHGHGHHPPPPPPPVYEPHSYASSASSYDAPVVVKAPVDEAPAYDTPVDEAPAYDTPADEAPTYDTPADDTPADEAPADDTPADEAPATTYDDYSSADSSATEYDSNASTPDDVIKEADKNGDGQMDMEEAENYLYKRGLPAVKGYRVKRSLLDLDLNNDNFITADEIEPYQ